MSTSVRPARALLGALAVLAPLVGTALLGTAAAAAPVHAAAPAAGVVVPTADAPPRPERGLVAEARLDGAGPVTAWLGGAAQRTYILVVTNTGTKALKDPAVTITGGSSTDPTTVLATPKIGSVAVGRSLEYQLPITIKAFSWGDYRVKASFTDLDAPTSVTTSTSSYPWILLGIGLVMLQPLLLGLYKRRPVVVEPRPPAERETVDAAPRGSARHRRT